MNWTFAALIGFLVVWGIVAPLLMRRSKVRETYARMNDRKLVETNTQARMMKRTARVMSYLSPLILALAGSLLRGARDNSRLFFTLAVLVLVAGLACVRFFGELELITTQEMDFRKFRSEKEAGGREADRGGAPTK